jgi:hypothetical protein
MSAAAGAAVGAAGALFTIDYIHRNHRERLLYPSRNLTIGPFYTPSVHDEVPEGNTDEERMESAMKLRGFRNYKVLSGKEAYMICFHNEGKMESITWNASRPYVCYERAKDYHTAMKNAIEGKHETGAYPHNVRGQDAIW